MYDLLIKEGWIIDGTGNPWYRADVAIQGGRIVALGAHLAGEAHTIVPADRRIVCPGFIDTHAHSDWWLMAHPSHEPKVLQGIATEIIGQDGFSLAPVGTARADDLRQLIAGMDGDPPLDWTWNTFNEYLEALQHAQPAVNVAALVGHGTLRFVVMGMEDRPATAEDLNLMKALLSDALEQGAVGMSTGLLYSPCSFADQSELLALSRVVADHNGVLVVHLRSEGDRLLESLEEMLFVASQSGVPLHISHLKVFGRQNWGRSRRVLERLEEARAHGIDVTFDQYPYIAGSTGLVVILPPWAQAGGTERVLQRLLSPSERRRIKEDIARGGAWDNFMRSVGPDRIIISWTRSEANRWAEGKSLTDAASIAGKDPLDFALDLLWEEQLAVSMVNFCLSEEDVRRIMAHPLQMVATDGILLGRPHPRAYGTYPRILGHYVREEKLLPLEQAVRKMTSFPAQRFRLRDRGILRVGNWADIVVFDPLSIKDRSTFEDPFQYPDGIEAVIVNGELTCRSGMHTGAGAGRVVTPH